MVLSNDDFNEEMERRAREKRERERRLQEIKSDLAKIIPVDTLKEVTRKLQDHQRLDYLPSASIAFSLGAIIFGNENLPPISGWITERLNDEHKEKIGDVISEAAGHLHMWEPDSGFTVGKYFRELCAVVIDRNGWGVASSGSGDTTVAPW